MRSSTFIALIYLFTNILLVITAISLSLSVLSEASWEHDHQKLYFVPLTTTSPRTTLLIGPDRRFRGVMLREEDVQPPPPPANAKPPHQKRDVPALPPPEGPEPSPPPPPPPAPVPPSLF